MVDDDSFDSDDEAEKHSISRLPVPSNVYGDNAEEEMDDDDDYNEDDDDDDEGEDLSLELGCPFCSEDYDALGLCLHIQDQHLVETKSGVCPVCAANSGKDMVSHLIIQHKSMLKALHKLKRHDHSCSTVSLMRKKLLDEHQRCRKASSTTVSSINVAPDPLLRSFINNSANAHKPEAVPYKPSIRPSLAAKSSDEITLERYIPSQSLPQTDEGEETKKSEFVQALLLSTILHDDL